MSAPVPFTTVRVGALKLTVSGHTIETDVRILRAQDGSYRLLSGTLSEPWASIEEAARAASAPRSADVACEVHWREDAASLGPDEHACPMCGAPVFRWSRYPRQLCPACVLEATDRHGRPLGFTNSGLSGGFEARYKDDGSRYAGGECFVRGVRCLAEEHRFGGIVVQPMA